ncbi:hypothetical protein [Vibrio sonorensis]|uniref:hypothetical protein n=1 Tax=Vibrio sonorensis TaxID=1004316 RepID=UPI0008DA8631|nr:hypothetical protein [Vibrio sonorensis]
MKTNNNAHSDTLCCPLCGSDEYLLSEKDTMLCAGCGSTFNNVSKLSTKPVVFAAKAIKVTHFIPNTFPQ